MSFAQKTVVAASSGLVVLVFVCALFVVSGNTVHAASAVYSNGSYSGAYSWMNTLVTKSQLVTTTLVCPKGEYVLRNVWGEFSCAPRDIRASYSYGKLYYPYTKVTYTNTGSFHLGYR